MAKSQKYDASSIDVNLGLDMVRKTPQVYLGNPDSHGIFHCVKEMVDNAVDECAEGHSGYLGVVLDNDSVWVYDEGRGIPVEKHKVTKISTLTTVMTFLSAGGKMRAGKGSSYKSTVGIHGMGISITCAMSESMDVYTKRNGKWWTQSFAKGKAISEVKTTKSVKVPLLKGKASKLSKRKAGTVIRFKPDYSVFDKGSKLEEETLRNFLDLTSYLHPKVKIFYSTKKKTEIFYQPKGLQSYVERILENKKAEKLGKPFILQTNSLDIALQWSTHADECVFSFVNGSMTSDGGTHVTGLNKAITESLKSFRKARSKYKPEDLRAGLLAGFNAKVLKPRFSSQVKNSLATPEVTKEVADVLIPELTKFFNANKSLARSIVKRADEIQTAFAQFKASKKSAGNLKVKQKGKIIFPEKLLQASTKNNAEREFFIVEGDSAYGTAIKARDIRTQEVLPLKGKPINAYKDRKGKLFDNKEVQNILKSMGYDPTIKDPLKNLRYGKIILLSDADPDGQHINILLLSLMYKLAPNLIETGKIYAVDDLLFKYESPGGNKYAANMSELRSLVKGNFNTDKVTRIKGWGEIDPDTLNEIAFNPETRRLIQIIPSKNKNMARKFINLVGLDVQSRKELLNIDIDAKSASEDAEADL